MDISNIKPPVLTLPHIGDVRLWILTLNSMSWVSENAELEASIFVRAFLEQQAVRDDGSSVQLAEISDEQLLDIVQELVIADKNDLFGSDKSQTEPEEINSIADFKSYLLKRTADSKERMSKVVQDSLGLLHHSRGTKDLLESMKSPSLRLQEMFETPAMKAFKVASDPFGLSAIQSIINPVGMDIVQAVKWSPSALFSAKNLLGPDVWSLQRQLSKLSSSLTLRSDYASTISQLTKEFSAVSTAQKALLESARPNTLDKAYLAANLKRPGFEMTVQAALSGMTSKAAAAEIIEHYAEQPSKTVSVLDAAKETIQGLDTIAENDPEALKSLANAVPTKMGSIDVVHIALLLQFLQLTLTALMLYAAMTDNGDEVIREGFTVIEEYLDETQRQYALEQDNYKNDRLLTSRYHLRDGPSTEATSLTILMPDRIVNVKKTDGNWAYVEVYPYGIEPSLYGWVYRYGLRPI